MSSKIIQFLILFIAASNLLTAQVNKDPLKNRRWHKGEVILSDGQKIEGEFNYNFLTNTLSEKKGDSFKAYSPTMVSSFTLYDEVHDYTATFYSIPASPDYSNQKVWYFMEVLKEYDHIAILSRYDFIEGTEKSAITDRPRLISNNSNPIIEHVYIVTKSGKVVKYALRDQTNYLDMHFGFSQLYKFGQGDNLENRKNRLTERRFKSINKSALSYAFGNKYEAMQKFMKSSKNNGKTMKSLIKIVEHYSSLLEQ